MLRSLACSPTSRFRSLAAGGLAALACLALSISTASAKVPGQLRHQGRLLNDRGEPATGTKTLKFAIYDAQTGGAVVWEGQSRDVELNDKGFYSVAIGSSSNPIAPDALQGGQRWLQITVDGTEMSPRLSLDSTPYAALAGEAESVSEGTIDSDALANGAVDSEAIASGAVDGDALADDADVDWSNVSNKPNGLDDGDNDTLAGLSCQPGYLLEYDGNDWSCAQRPSLAGKQCASGQVARGYKADGTIICAQDTNTQLDEQQVDQFVSNNGYAQQSSLSNYAEKANLSSVARSGNFGDLSNVRSGLADGDDVEDGDADSSNELQDLSRNGDTLSLSQDGSDVDLSAYKDNTDNQNLSDVLSQGDDAGGNDISNAGNVTANKVTSQNTIDAEDGVKLGSTSNCNSNNEGALRYNSGSIQFCDGNGWQPLPTEAYNHPEHGAETDELYHFAMKVPGAGQWNTKYNAVLHCAPMTDDNEPYQYAEGGVPSGDEGAYIDGFGSDVNGHCFDHPNWSDNNDECIAIKVTNWESRSHEGFGAWCRRYPGSSNGETVWAQINVESNEYRTSTGITESISRPQNVGDVECTSSGRACVKRVR